MEDEYTVYIPPNCFALTEEQHLAELQSIVLLQKVITLALSCDILYVHRRVILYVAMYFYTTHCMPKVLYGWRAIRTRTSTRTT